MARIQGTAGTAPRAKPAPKPKAQPKPKPFVLKTPHDVGTTAQPPRRGHAPTVFQQPLGLGHPAPRTPTQKMVDQERRHVARGVLHSRGVSVNRPLKKQDVNAILSDPGVKADLKSALPFIPKEHPHHGLLHNIVHGVGNAASDVGTALTARGNDNGIRQSFISHKQADKADKAIQGALGELNKVPAALTARPNPNNPLAPIGTKLTNKVEKAVGGELKRARKGANKYNTHNTASLAPTGQPNPTVKKLVKNAGKDLIGLPANAIQSTYLTVAHPNEVAKSVLEQIKHPVKTAEQHPVNTLLTLSGLESALSRGSGAALRSGALGPAGKKFASTERPDLRLTGKATVQRRYSKGLTANRLQKAVDRRAVKKGRGTTVVKGGKEVPAIQATDKQMYGGALGGPVSGHLNRRIDQEVGTNQGVVSNRRLKALNAMHQGRPSLREAGRLKRGVSQMPNHVDDAAALVLEGELKAGDLNKPNGVEHALHASRDRIAKAAQGETEPHAKALTAANLKHIDNLLADKHFLADPRHVLQAAEDFVKVHGNSITHGGLEAERIKYGDFSKLQAQLRVVRPFAIRELGLKWNVKTERFENPEGNPVPLGTIVSEFKARGGNPAHLGYVKQFQELNNPKSYLGGAGGQVTRPGRAPGKFKGVNTLPATYHRSYAGLAEQLAHATAKVARHENINGLVNNFGHLQPDGRYFDAKGAEAEIRNLRAAGKGEYVARSVARQSAPDTLMGELHPAELEQSFRKVEPGDSHVVLFPRKVISRIEQHENLRGRNAATRGVQTATQYFRHTVLPTSTKWLAGNTLESLLRSAINDPTLIRSMLTGHNLQKNLAALGPEGERQLERLQVGASAGLFTSQKYIDYYRPDEGEFMQRAHAFRQNPYGPKIVGDAWDAYKKVVFAGNQRLESSVYWSAIGREAQREVQSVFGAWNKTLNLAGPAYQDVAKGLLDSNNVARYVRAVDDMRGRYANLSPSGRWLTATYTPFAPWYVNALHFIYVTMPAHHPVLTGVEAGLNSATEQRRQGLGLKPWMTGTIGGYDVNRYAPTGIYSGGLKSIPGMVVPEVSGIGMNLFGLDWTGKKLPPGTSVLKVALNTAGETFTPFLSRARTVAEKGGVSVPGSSLIPGLGGIKVKPGTKKNIGAGFNKAFNPFRKTSTGSGVSPTDVNAILKQAGIGNAPSVDQILKSTGHGSAPNVDDVLKNAGVK